MGYIIVGFISLVVGVIGFGVLVVFIPNVADIVTEFLANVCSKISNFFLKLEMGLRDAYGG